jgi:site-specific DNA-methyltransferase (adenine-specific)
MPKIELLNCNCLDALTWLEPGSVDMVLADLPYGTTACKWDICIPFEPLWEQLHRVCKLNAAMCMFGSEPFSSRMRMSNLKRFKYDWIWKKTSVVGFANAKKQPLRNVEICSVFYSGMQPRYFPQDLKRISLQRKNGIMHTKSIGEKGKSAINGGRFKVEYKQEFTNYPKQILEFSREYPSLHPTPKPVALLEYLIKTYTVEGETVLDPTMGSGSTGVACKNLNRNFIGFELDEKYFEIAKKRINEPRDA